VYETVGISSIMAAKQQAQFTGENINNLLILSIFQ
jgi:hypothetical protein